jgi:hypothetical protein
VLEGGHRQGRGASQVKEPWWSRFRRDVASLRVVEIRPPGMSRARFILFALLAVALGLILGALPLVVLVVVGSYLLGLFWFSL